MGKSTLFNRISGDRAAIVSETPGTTRDRLTMQAEWAGVGFADVDAVKDEQVIVNIESQSTVGALDGSDSAGVRHLRRTS